MPTSKNVNQNFQNFRGFRSWLLAARPKTLAASVIPTVLGSALAYRNHSFDVSIAILCLSIAIAIQIATNFINDAADFEKGADTEERLGPPRAAQMGLLEPKQLYFAAGILLFLILLAGIYLSIKGGVIILVLGIASILSAIAYTKGPYPLAYYGLGDIFVLVFFGIVALGGTYYAQAQEWNFLSLCMGFIIGLQATALIIVNNTRDIPTDIKVGKKTFSARLGLSLSKKYHKIILFTSYALLIFLFFQKQIKIFELIPLASLFYALKCIKQMDNAITGTEYNIALVATVKHQVLFAVLAFFAIIFTILLQHNAIS